MSALVSRSGDGKHMAIRHLDTQVFFDDMFAECKTPKEVEWLTDQLTSYLDRASEEQMERVGPPEGEADE